MTPRGGMRAIRQCAFQALFLIDADPGLEAAALRASMERMLDEDPDLGPGLELDVRDLDEAMALARRAWEERGRADKLLAGFAPEWPAHRQPAVDRCVLRLACCEILGGRVPPKVAVNEAVELAKAFGTERSPGFVNAVLDKVLRAVRDDLPSSSDSSGVQL